MGGVLSPDDAPHMGDGRAAAVTRIRRVGATGLYNRRRPPERRDVLLYAGRAVTLDPRATLLAPLRALFARGFACRALEAGAARPWTGCPRARRWRR